MQILSNLQGFDKLSKALIKADHEVIQADQLISADTFLSIQSAILYMVGHAKWAALVHPQLLWSPSHQLLLFILAQSTASQLSLIPALL